MTCISTNTVFYVLYACYPLHFWKLQEIYGTVVKNDISDLKDYFRG